MTMACKAVKKLLGYELCLMEPEGFWRLLTYLWIATFLLAFLHIIDKDRIEAAGDTPPTNLSNMKACQCRSSHGNHYRLVSDNKASVIDQQSYKHHYWVI